MLEVVGTEDEVWSQWCLFVTELAPILNRQPVAHFGLYGGSYLFKSVSADRILILMWLNYHVLVQTLLASALQPQT